MRSTFSQPIADLKYGFSQGILVIYGSYERLLRGGDAWSFWQRCTAGLSALGIEADGANPSLPTSASTRGNIRDHSLRIIIEETEELRFNLGAGTSKGTEHLWGFWKTCEFAELSPWWFKLKTCCYLHSL